MTPGTYRASAAHRGVAALLPTLSEGGAELLHVEPVPVVGRPAAAVVLLLEVARIRERRRVRARGFAPPVISPRGTSG